MNFPIILERAQEAWAIIAIGTFFLGSMLGWTMHKAKVQNRVEVRAVFRKVPNGGLKPIGWRPFLGRRRLGDIYNSEQEAERHAEAIREDI